VFRFFCMLSLFSSLIFAYNLKLFTKCISAKNSKEKCFLAAYMEVDYKNLYLNKDIQSNFFNAIIEKKMQSIKQYNNTIEPTKKRYDQVCSVKKITQYLLHSTKEKLLKKCFK